MTESEEDTIERHVDRSPFKKSKHNKTGGKQSSETQSYPNRAFTIGISTGEMILKIKCPRIERMAYTYFAWEALHTDQKIVETLYSSGTYTLHDEDNINNALSDGRTTGYFWNVIVYVSDNTTKNTKQNRENWATNHCKYLNRYFLKNHKYDNIETFQYIEDITPPVPPILSDYLITRDVFEIMKRAYKDSDIHKMIKNKKILKLYFGSDERIIIAKNEYSIIYPTKMENDISTTNGPTDPFEFVKDLQHPFTEDYPKKISPTETSTISPTASPTENSTASSTSFTTSSPLEPCSQTVSTVTNPYIHPGNTDAVEPDFQQPTNNPRQEEKEELKNKKNELKKESKKHKTKKKK